MSQSLRDILAQIRGEKIKDRQEGLTAIRSAFSSDAAIEKFDSEGDGLRWLVVYQALFTAVAIEKKACFSKKGTTAAERRLSDTAATMRWLMERSVLSLSRKSVRALLSHLSQTLSHEGRLLTVVALDYLKAIRCIIIHAPHLEHMDNEMWIVILRTAFNIILGDSLGTELDEPSAAAEHKDMDDGEENPDSDEEMLGSDTSGPRKRRRIQESSSSRSFASSHHSIKHRTASLEQIESASLVSILLDSPSTPLLSSMYTYLPAGVLGRLSAILRVYPSDSSIYHDILSAVTASLQHLSLNHKDAVTRFAVESWEDLLALWSIRIIGLKERLIAILKTIFPYCSAARHQESTHSSVAMNNIGKLYQLLESLPDARKGIEGIDLDRLRLQIVEEASQSDPTNRVFCAHTFRAGQDFDRSQALAWAVLELYADCIAEVPGLTLRTSATTEILL
jgi:serine-protein kinase ATM